jgi:hypothetical protein
MRILSLHLLLRAEALADSLHHRGCFAPRTHFAAQKFQRDNLLTILLQVTQRRVPTSSRPDASNATLSVRVRETRSVLTSTDCSVVTLVPSKASHTPMPTSKRVSNGTTILSYVSHHTNCRPFGQKLTNSQLVHIP